MMTAGAVTQLRRWRRLSWPHPEWWSLCLCAAAWLALLSRGGADHAGQHAAHAGQHAAHGHAAHAAGAAALSGATAGWAAESFWWLVMTTAMMFPMVLDPVRAAAARSLWPRRHRAIVGFLAGYLVPWMLFGVAAAAATSGLRGLVGLRTAAALGFGAAVLWQVAPAKRRALLACHRVQPLAPAGWRADRDCLKYGWMVGGACLSSCWALMLACVLVGHSVPAMACATAVGWAERNTARPNQRLLCAVIAALGVTYAVAARV